MFYQYCTFFCLKEAASDIANFVKLITRLKDSFYHFEMCSRNFTALSAIPECIGFSRASCSVITKNSFKLLRHKDIHELQSWLHHFPKLDALQDTRLNVLKLGCNLSTPLFQFNDACQQRNKPLKSEGHLHSTKQQQFLLHGHCRLLFIDAINLFYIFWITDMQAPVLQIQNCLSTPSPSHTHPRVSA